MMIHASAVAIGGRVVLIAGASGRGKSDLALRAIDRGAALVSDDYTLLEVRDRRLHASAPETIAGRIEVRGVGIVTLPAATGPVCLHVDLDRAPERLPEPEAIELLGLAVPTVALAALEPSAPVKLEWALDMFGLPTP